MLKRGFLIGAYLTVARNSCLQRYYLLPPSHLQHIDIKPARNATFFLRVITQNPIDQQLCDDFKVALSLLLTNEERVSATFAEHRVNTAHTISPTLQNVGITCQTFKASCYS
jgi:hypothetical protein